MRDKDYQLSLLDYNVWANEQYFRKIRELPDAEVIKQRPSLMNNLLILVNHLLVIGKVWMAHLKGESHAFGGLQTILHENLDELFAAKRDMDGEIRDYVAGLDGDALEEVIDYELIGGNTGSLPRYMIITHLAVHGGFHRRHVRPNPCCPGGPGYPGVGAGAAGWLRQIQK